VIAFSAHLGILFPELAPLERPAAARAAGYEAVEAWWPPAPHPGDWPGAVRAAGLRAVLVNADGGDLAAGERGFSNLPERAEAVVASARAAVHGATSPLARAAMSAEEDWSGSLLAGALAELTTTAREGKAQPADLAGGTITITNVGVFGVDAGTPILTPGEAAILAFGQVREMPWVHEGELAVRQVTTLSLSFDHRIVDGDLGSAVLRDVGTMLTDPVRMLAWC